MSDVLGPGQDPEVERLIEARRYREAVDLLSPQLPEDSEGRLHALAAVAHYGLEEYQEPQRTTDWRWSAPRPMGRGRKC